MSLFFLPEALQVARVRGGKTSMGLDLLDLVFRLQRSLGARIIRSVRGSPRLYDSVFDSPAEVPKKSRRHASQDPWGNDDDGPSSGGISVLSGSPVTTWSTLPLTTRSQTEYSLRLSPDSPVIIGRSDGWSPEYLDPAYRPTRIVPGTGQAVLRSGGYGADNCVSRAPSCSWGSRVAYSSSTVFLGGEGVFDHRSMGPG